MLVEMSDREIIKLGVLIEDLQSQIQRLSEALSEVPETVRQTAADVEVIKTDMGVVRAVVTDQSRELADREHRLRLIESAN